MRVSCERLPRGPALTRDLGRDLMCAAGVDARFPSSSRRRSLRAAGAAARLPGTVAGLLPALRAAAGLSRAEALRAL
jgi:hypothetical protein